MKTLSPLTLHFSHPDFQRGLVFLLATCAGVSGAILVQAPLLSSVWLCIGTTLSGVAFVGKDKSRQILYYSKFIFVSSLAIGVGTLTQNYLNSWVFYCLLAGNVLVIFAFVPTIKQLAKAIPIVASLAVLASGFPMHVDLTILSFMYNNLMPFLLGCVLSLLATLILPKVNAPYPEAQSTQYVMLRAVRIALGIAVVFYICHMLKLTHATWAALSIIAVSQGTLGGTVKKALYRLTGTALGVFIAAPMAHYLFQPFPYSRLLVLVFFFIAFVVIAKKYTFSIFLLTVPFGALFYIISPDQSGLLPFILERLVETTLGVFIIIALESFISPYSAIHPMRTQAYEYWNELSLSLSDQSPNSFYTHCNAAKRILKDLQTSAEEFRYEPLTIMTKHYHYSIQCINSMFHYRTLLIKSYEANELNPALSQNLELYHRELSHQHALSLQARALHLNSLKKKIKKDIDDNEGDANSTLIVALLKLIDFSLHTIKARGLKY